MSLLKGKLTFRRFVADGDPPDSSARLLELLQRDAFRGTLEDPRKEERSGWVSIHNLLRTRFSVADSYHPPYLLFALRTDRKAIPPALMRALVDRESTELLESSGLERLPPGSKSEIRERIEEKYLPRILPNVTQVEVCWNLVDNTVWVASSSERAVDRVRKAFSGTFGRVLHAVTAPRLAVRGSAAADRFDALSVTGATDLLGGTGGAR